MAKDKKLTAKVNGVKVTDGEIVTVVVQAKVKVYEGQKFGGTERFVYVALEPVDTDVDDFTEGVYLETEYAEKGRKTELPGATIIKVKP